MKLNARDQIKTLLAQRATTLKSLSKMIEEKTGKKCTSNNLSHRLLNGTLRYDEMLIICEILGFEISFKDILN